MRTHDREMIDGYADLALQRVEHGFTVTLLTFMFRELGGSAAGRQGQMMREVERTYHRALTYVWRRPMRMDPFYWPCWFACPDWPVFKHFPDHLANIVINDGQHAHTLALTPPVSRLKTSLEGHILDNQQRYFPADGLLHRINAETVTDSPELVVDYVLKSIPRNRCGWDDVLVLPRARSEMTRLTRAERHAEREERSKQESNPFQAPGSRLTGPETFVCGLR